MTIYTSVHLSRFPATQCYAPAVVTRWYDCWQVLTSSSYGLKTVSGSREAACATTTQPHAVPTSACSPTAASAVTYRTLFSYGKSKDYGFAL